MKKNEIILSIKVQRILSIIALFIANIWNISCILKIRPMKEFYYSAYVLTAFFLSFFFTKLIFQEIKLEKSLQWKYLTKSEKIWSVILLVLLLLWGATYLYCIQLK